jgi:NAD(P)-dependent dehydrogenase (short-subunit alcohol dehydrogenase family)
MKLDGKTCLITGANSGLGLAIAKNLAVQGARVILVCRDSEKVEKTMEVIRTQTPAALLDGLVADLSSMSSIRSLIDQLNQNYGSLNILINNAAVMKMKREITPDGFESMFQTNYLAPFLLSTGLTGLLEKGKPSQIINIAVPSPKQRVNFCDLQFEQKFSSYSAFFQTKLYLLLFSLELSNRLAGSGVKVNCMEPGGFRSNLTREAPGLIHWLFRKVSPTAESASEYIQNFMEKADKTSMTGRVFSKDKEKPVVDYWKNRAIREQLWNETEKLISRMNKNN